jgi:hypothetical protein
VWGIQTTVVTGNDDESREIVSLKEEDVVRCVSGGVHGGSGESDAAGGSQAAATTVDEYEEEEIGDVTALSTCQSLMVITRCMH